MRFQTHLSDVEEVLVNNLVDANERLKIYCNVFTNRHIFDAVVMRQRRGVQVSFALLDTTTNRQSSIAWERLTAIGGNVFWLSEKSVVDFDPSQEFLLIDTKRVVSGHFKLGVGTSTETPVNFLEYSDQITVNYFQSTFDLLTGEKAIVTPHFESISALIENPQIQWQRSQALFLQTRILAIQSEIAEINRQIHQFEHQKDQAIGSLIRRYLDVKRRYMNQIYKRDLQAESKIKAEEADRIYQQYTDACLEMSADIKPVELNTAQLDELKQLYRKLAMQCHPDRVEEANKENAQVFFQLLQLNYKNNDLTSLKNLKQQIDSKLCGVSIGVLYDDTSRLTLVLSELQSSITTLTQQVSKLKQSSTWNELNTHVDWDTLFSRHAEQLEREMQRYMNKLEHAKHAD
jgi:hypothetical protein